MAALYSLESHKNCPKAYTNKNFLKLSKKLNFWILTKNTLKATTTLLQHWKKLFPTQLQRKFAEQTARKIDDYIFFVCAYFNQSLLGYK